jgi:2-haloacid dehalogenase
MPSRSRSRRSRRDALRLQAARPAFRGGRGVPGRCCPPDLRPRSGGGIALAAVGGYADFQDRPKPSPVRARRRGQPQGSLDEAGVILAGMAALARRPERTRGHRAPLHRAGVRVATLTNGSASTAQSPLERAGVERVVEANLAVGEAGAGSRRPSPPRLPPARHVRGSAVLIAASDSSDLHGANHPRLRGAWLNRSSAPHPTSPARRT